MSHDFSFGTWYFLKFKRSLPTIITTLFMSFAVEFGHKCLRLELNIIILNKTKIKIP